MGAIIGGLSGLAVLLMTYLGTRSTSTTTPIQEVRMQGEVQSLYKNSAPGMLLPGLGLEPLRRSDYDVVGRAEGYGCAHYVALWPIPFFWVDQEGGSMHFFNANAENIAEQAAWYDTLKSLPAADALLSPRTETSEYQTFSLWYRRDCVRLRAKGIEIKLDKKVEK